MNKSEIQKKIYIAGFDVFSDDAKQIGENYKRICSEYGFQGFYPLDNEEEQSNAIFLGNVSLINQCDIIVANLNDFRGTTMDDGTAFELGYGYAKNKILYGYMDHPQEMTIKIGTKDENGYNVEDFGHPINLMIAESTTIISGDFEECIRQLSLNLELKLTLERTYKK